MEGTFSSFYSCFCCFFRLSIKYWNYIAFPCQQLQVYSPKREINSIKFRRRFFFILNFMFFYEFFRFFDVFCFSQCFQIIKTHLYQHQGTIQRFSLTPSNSAENILKKLVFIFTFFKLLLFLLFFLSFIDTLC